MIKKMHAETKKNVSNVCSLIKSVCKNNVVYLYYALKWFYNELFQRDWTSYKDYDMIKIIKIGR